MEAWRQDFIAATKDIASDIPYSDSAKELQRLIRTEKLLFTDMRDAPSKFFAAHRLLLAPNDHRLKQRGPGFGIRFTVQFNLFAGSILGLGSDEQVAMLKTFQNEGRLGCFCLTERFAGVNSGLVVQTTATWIPEKQAFNINCPDEGAEKNWISQGLTASKAVVIADLVVSGQHHGPHGFLVDLDEHEGSITRTDMGLKTTGNDLDNARIKFDNVIVPKAALLSKYADIKNDEYFQPTEEKMRLEVIGQRLLTGRLAISQAAVVFTRNLFEKTKIYAKQRRVWSPAEETHLADLPQLKYLFEMGDYKLDRLDEYTKKVEDEISDTLTKSKIPSLELVERIAVAKIACVETAIDLCFKLKQEVGSYGLMAGTGFENLDFLQCCKFAEGDSRILGQKIARDTMKKFSQGKVTDKNVAKKCQALFSAMKSDAKEEDMFKKWNHNWKLVYDIVDAVEQMHFVEMVGTPSKL